jgi:hypothetical protein
MTSKISVNTTDIMKEDQFLNNNKLFGLPLDMIYKGWGNSVQILDSNSLKISDIMGSS